jgi:hypothetical protein
MCLSERTASCHLGHTHLITEVKQRWARIVVGWVPTQIPGLPGAVIRCTPPVSVKYCRMSKEKKNPISGRTKEVLKKIIPNSKLGIRCVFVNLKQTTECTH